MNTPHLIQRRRVLKALGTATLLPLSSVGLASVQYPSEASASLIPTTAAGVQTPAVGELVINTQGGKNVAGDAFTITRGF